MSQAQRLQGLKGPAALYSSNIPKPAASSSKNSSSKSSTKKDNKNAVLTGLPYNTPLQRERLERCDWKDRLIYSSRMLLGGNNVNGFLRGTATAQRIKKQRARQVGITKKTAASQAAGTGPDGSALDKNKKPIFSQEEEEKLKKEVMNPRTAKKLKAEMEASVQFCAQIHNLLRGIIMDVDHRQVPYLPPMLPSDSDPSTRGGSLAAKARGASYGTQPPTFDVAGARASKTGPPSIQAAKLQIQMQQASQTTASPGNPEGSSLRRFRRKKLPPNTEAPADVPEFDGSGRRLCTKKEHQHRLFEVLRFRGLRQGDFVAARTTSRDLWILARVLKDFPGMGMAPLDFLQLSEPRRDALFREKVPVKDVEEKDGSSSSLVARSLVLPLPRTYSEAADWGQRLKKGMRVYAMYPQTTSLYPATVTDSTTYCRGDDDIIVVEFDGEEHDATGQVPKFHIPARFVTLVPRELPAAQVPGSGAKSGKRKSLSSPGHGGTPKMQKTDDFMSFDFDGNFDALDLDFDKPLGADDDDPGFPPLI